MIFITVGTQAPFDRLIEAIDRVAENFPGIEFIAQVLDGGYRPKHLKTSAFYSPKEFDALFKAADLVISHAGMGTIISALTDNKPLLILPRQAELGEHRNNHQLATAKKFTQLGYVHVARDEFELSADLAKVLCANEFKVLYKTTTWASQELISSLKNDCLTLGGNRN